MEKKEYKCRWHEVSRAQRKSELENKLGLLGTEGFERIGCYKCNGLNKDCKSYYLNKQKKNE